MPDKVVGHMKDWGNNSKRKDHGKFLQFLNIIKEKYDWDNDELEELEGLVEDEVSHPNIPE